MGKRHSISPARHFQIVPLHFDGWSYREIAKELQCFISVCQHAVHNYEHFASYKDQDRVSRPKKSTPKQDRITRLDYLAKPFLCGRFVIVAVCRFLIRKILKILGLRV